MDNDIVIVKAKRTAIGNFGGGLSKIEAPKLGAIVIENLIQEANIDSSLISEVIMGQVLTAGCGQNPARQAAIHACIPKEKPALTINQVCGSGLKAVHLAIQALKCGDADIIIAGGQENMSLSPHLLQGSRLGFRMGNANLVDSMVHDGLTDVYNQYHMGITAENIATQYNISREEQDEFALNSQLKALNAQHSNKFIEEIVPVTIPQKKEDTIVFFKDEFVRSNITIEALSALKAAFKKDGTVTAGNASGINDGAAAVMLMTERKARELGLTPLVRIKAYSSVGLEPTVMGLGPIYATLDVMQKSNWSVSDLDLVEANEAFAAQAIAVNKELKLNPEIVNVNGGAIALGHPIGASGCRVLVTLIHEMKRRKVEKGLATLCIGGGMGVALTVENIE